MFTRSIEVTTVKTSLKELMATAGKTFPNDHAYCIGLILQIDSAVDIAETIEVLGLDASAGEGIILSNDGLVGPSFNSFRVDRLDKVYLVASADTLKLRCQVETDGR